ncbi:MAG: hypothetical protein KJZ75_11380 [Hyphomonadaceae bacterium]|nr:hypothetical protein [Hyphomonadaceae bacterium]
MTAPDLIRRGAIAMERLSNALLDAGDARRELLVDGLEELAERAEAFVAADDDPSDPTKSASAPRQTTTAEANAPEVLRDASGAPQAAAAAADFHTARGKESAAPAARADQPAKSRTETLRAKRIAHAQAIEEAKPSSPPAPQSGEDEGGADVPSPGARAAESRRIKSLEAVPAADVIASARSIISVRRGGR